MRVVVTGSSGRIGQQVVKELAAHDYQVVATDIARAPRGVTTPTHRSAPKSSGFNKDSAETSVDKRPVFNK